MKCCKYRQLAMILVLGMMSSVFSRAALAQPGEPTSSQQNETDTAAQEPTEPSADSEAQGDQAASGQAQDERPDIDNQPIENGAGNRPGRFIPSEQISLDFGVSFPVDV